jgi:hypothetical protein
MSLTGLYEACLEDEFVACFASLRYPIIVGVP